MTVDFTLLNIRQSKVSLENHIIW